MFGEAIGALEALAKLIKGASGLSKRRRKKYLDAVTEAFTLLQTAIILVETKLGDLLSIADDYELTDAEKRRRFIQDLANLDNTERWLALEREVLLCRGLRLASRELEGAFDQMWDQVALKDRRSIRKLIQDVLERERMLASFISESLEGLAAMAFEAQTSPQGRTKAWRAVKRKRRQLTKERRSLIAAEQRFLDSI